MRAATESPEGATGPWTAILQTSGARSYWLVGGFITTMISAHYLGPSGRGIYAAAVGWVALFSTFGHLSLSQVVVFRATGKDKDEWLPDTFGTMLALVGVLALIGWCVAGAVYLFTRGEAFGHIPLSVLVLAFASLPILLWLESGNSTLISLGELNVLNGAQVVGTTAGIFFTFLLVGVLRYDIEGGLVAVFATQLLISSVGIARIRRHARQVRFNPTVARELLAGGSKLHMNAVGTFLFAQANVLLLNYYRTPAETGFFQIAVQLLTALQVIPLAVSTVAYSIVARKGPDEAWPEQRSLLLKSLAIMVCVGAVAYVSAPAALVTVGGAAFLPSVPVFRILLLTLIGATCSMVMASQWIGRGLFKTAAFLSLGVGIASFAANMLVIPSHGMVGAAWVSVAVYSVSIIGNGIMAVIIERRVRRLRINEA